MMVVAASKIAGIADHWTGTVNGWNLVLAKVTENRRRGAGTSIEQGVTS
jgi:hypothetical protein